jgi:hypothetical protein
MLDNMVRDWRMKAAILRDLIRARPDHAKPRYKSLSMAMQHVIMDLCGISYACSRTGT